MGADYGSKSAMRWKKLSLGAIIADERAVASMPGSKQNKGKERAPENRESDLFDSAFQYATIGMALVAPDGSWLKVNPALCRLLGYAESELLKTNFQAITHPEDLEGDLQHVKEMLAGTRETYQMEKRYLHKDGSVIWALLSVSLVWRADGKPAFFISQVQDISARKEAEEELQRSNSRLKKALAERDRLKEELLTICAWTKKVQVDGKWVPVEVFLKERLGIQTSHGISDEALKKIKTTK
jgi:PAS domain S-box-containing protein